MLEKVQKWDGLTGGTIKGKQRRMYKMNFNRKEKPLEEKIDAFMSPVIRAILRKYHPHLFQLGWHEKCGAIKSLPGAESQYEGHGYKLHSDYPDAMLKRPFDEQPLSIIFALDSFKFKYLPDGCFSEDSLVTATVERGQAVVFTNKCLHSGGKNDSDSDAYRLFAYVTLDRSHVPIGTVRIFHWDSSRHIVHSDLDLAPSPRTNRLTAPWNDKNPASAKETESGPKAAQKETTAEDATDEGIESYSPTQSSKDKVNDKNPAPAKEAPAKETDTTEQTGAEQSAQDEEVHDEGKESCSSTQSSNKDPAKSAPKKKSDTKKKSASFIESILFIADMFNLFQNLSICLDSTGTQKEGQ
jgi:hypothetical protein